jgi:hypothetical protein
MRTSPPVWAEATLRLFLRPDVFLTVSGDLLEQYRDSILPTKGALEANRWYLLQVLGFVVRSILPWAGLFTAAGCARFAWDALQPTTDFHLRSLAITYTSIGILVTGGFRTAWRSGSFLAGVAAGFATMTAASLLSPVAIGTFLVFWHDASVMQAIAGSGGLSEAFVLPIILIVPGTIFSGIAGLVGAGAKRVAGVH